MEESAEGLKKKEKKQKREETHIPVEIVNEVLNRLPLETLARFKCVSSLWSSLITPIINRRLLEEFDRRKRRYKTAWGGLMAVFDELKELVDVEELRSRRVRYEIKMDEMLSILVFDDDMGRYLNGFPWYRDVVSELYQGVGELCGEIDALVDAAEAMRGEDGDA
ncbi:uncharacterized protein A4U43_C07F16630 [Asparagus officinalis]|uniref:F-box domain-containing protein n=1 Tax=Asparagus officinalis TaxID=4686 RepID=A0A5P1EFV5_ASPOF|nr:uncharacterized protein A4U43_C07F16630 [Asparagus officinalis]